MSLTDDKTVNYALPLPHPANEGMDDCLRLREALSGVDAALKTVADEASTKADVADIANGIDAALVGVNTALVEKADTIQNQTAHDALFAAIAAAEGKATWEGLTGKPETFPPSDHGHEWAEISGTPTVAAVPTPDAIPKSRPDGTLDAGWLPELVKPITVMTITPTVNANVVAGYENRIILHGVSALLDGTVTKYRITYDGDAPVTVTATSGDYKGHTMLYYDTRTNAEIETELLRYHGLPSNDAELSAIGVYPVIDEKPDHNVDLFRLEKDGDPTRTDDTFIQQWKTVPLRLSEAKANLKRCIAARRYEAETGGVTLPDGTRLPTDVEARTRFGTALSGCPADGNVSVKIDGTFHTLTHTEMTALVIAIARHVQACFDHERDLHELIDAAETVTDLEALDVTTGWPGSEE